MILPEEQQEKLAIGLYDRGALQFSNFEWTLKSGRKSPIYYNQRPLASIDYKNEDLSVIEQFQLRKLAVDSYVDTIGKLVGYGDQNDHLYGIPQAMTALGAMVAYERGDSILWGRVGSKDYGAHAKIEGNFYEGETVVCLDDVVTTAASKLETAEALTEAKLIPKGFVVMFDREEGGVEAVQKAGYEIISILGLAKTMEYLKDAGRIGNREFEWMAQHQEQYGE